MHPRLPLIVSAVLLAAMALDNGVSMAGEDARDWPYVTHAVVADLNADNKPDVVNNDLNGDGITVRLGQGDGTFSRPYDYGTGSGPIALAVDDFDGDSVPDVAVANYFDDDVSVYMGAGAGSLNSRVSFGCGGAGGVTSITTSDFDRNGTTDIVAAGTKDGICVLFGDGNGSFSQGPFNASGGKPWSLVAADLNRDGAPDLAVSNFENNSVSVLLGDGSGGFRSVVSYQGYDGPRELIVADVDRDGYNDLIVTNWLGNYVSVAMGNGNGTFQAGVKYHTGITPVSLAYSDINNDGRPDILVANSDEGNVVALYGTKDGGFARGRELGRWDAPHTIVTADFDGDGWQDLMVSYGYELEPDVQTGGLRFNVDVEADRPEMGSVSPAHGSYVYGSEVELTARPNPGYRFSLWKGNVDDTLSESTTMRVYKDETVVAEFEAE